MVIEGGSGGNMSDKERNKSLMHSYENKLCLGMKLLDYTGNKGIQCTKSLDPKQKCNNYALGHQNNISSKVVCWENTDMSGKHNQFKSIQLSKNKHKIRNNGKQLLIQCICCSTTSWLKYRDQYCRDQSQISEDTETYILRPIPNFKTLFKNSIKWNASTPISSFPSPDLGFSNSVVFSTKY